MPMSTPCHRFRNAIAILNSIDGDEFERATALGLGWWRRFRAEPALTFLQLDAPKAEALWRLVEARQPAGLRTAATVSIAAE